MGSKERYAHGREARLRAEVFAALQGVAVNYPSIYRRIEQANQFKRGWDSVTLVDIDVAVKQVQNAKQQLTQKGTNHAYF